MALIKLENIGKIYRTGKISFEALKNVSLSIEGGEAIAILGPSGSGKSTLMQIIGCLSTPTSGQYFLKDQEVSHFTRNQLAKVRGQNIGFIFQHFNLLPQLTAIENVGLPLVYQGVTAGKRNQRAQELLEKLGLADHRYHRPFELSGGQQQRVAIARALVTDPDVILGDEPTGNLDSQSGADVMQIFAFLLQEGKTVIIVTHDLQVAKRMKRIIEIRDGQVAGDMNDKK